jgi:pimeloyl-ACP methyl ester carboxylesterase
VPGWFTRALAVPFTEHVVDVPVPIHYVRWGASDKPKPSVILIHGGGAHAFWWGYLGPMLAETHDVVALDLSGHGDSGRREQYPREVWTEDVLAVMSHAGLPTRPVLVGHSMGGFVSMAMASLHGDKLAGAILVDSPVRPPADGTSSASPKRPPEPPAEQQSNRWTFQSMKPHADLATAIEHFRPLPEQPTPYPFLLDYVARRSVRPVEEGGFVWKFDPRVFERASRSSLRTYLGFAQCRLALIRGELSVVLPRETAEYMVTLVKDPVPLIEIPEGHHHLMFDQPLPFVVALRTLLADWRARPSP